MDTDAARDTGTGLATAFDRAAGRYDLLTGLNPGYHRHLASAARELARRLGDLPKPRLLDLGCGSGSSTAALLTALPGAGVVGVDASDGMLEQARAKSWPAGVRFVHAGAETLPSLGLPPADAAMAAYLFRNIPAGQRDDVLRAVHDQLEPGGWLVVQEYSVAGRRLAAAVWTAVCWAVVIPLALVVGEPEPVRVPVAQRSGVRQRGGVLRSPRRRRVHRVEPAGGPGLAARHPAHLPRASTDRGLTGDQPLQRAARLPEGRAVRTRRGAPGGGRSDRPEAALGGRSHAAGGRRHARLGAADPPR